MQNSPIAMTANVPAHTIRDMIRKAVKGYDRAQEELRMLNHAEADPNICDIHAYQLKIEDGALDVLHTAEYMADSASGSSVQPDLCFFRALQSVEQAVKRWMVYQHILTRKIYAS